MNDPGGHGRSKSAVLGKDANVALVRQHARQLNSIAATASDLTIRAEAAGIAAQLDALATRIEDKRRTVAELPGGPAGETWSLARAEQRPRSLT